MTIRNETKATIFNGKCYSGSTHQDLVKQIASEYLPEGSIGTATHDKVVDALLIATSKLDAVERNNKALREALGNAAKWLGKMIADGAHQNSVAPLHCERTLEHIESLLKDSAEPIAPCGHYAYRNYVWSADDFGCAGCDNDLPKDSADQSSASQRC